MILVDSSVWIDHFRSGNSRLETLLADDEVLTHSFVVGELACGRLRNRTDIMRMLRRLRHVETAADAEVLEFVNRYRLDGQGLGWIDVHLLAAARIAQVPLWTLDRRLDAAVSRLANR